MNPNITQDVAVGERAGHIPGRPISWVVVVLVCAGFVVAGVGLITALPWLFYTGAGVVVAGTILGWATHAMADVTAKVETHARAADAAEARDEARDAESRDAESADRVPN